MDGKTLTIRLEPEHVEALDNLKILLRESTFNKVIQTVLNQYEPLHKRKLELERQLEQASAKLHDIDYAVRQQQQAQQRLDQLLNNLK